ncbi:CRISPR system precrRNA processing endoribonuclease RAMP protein Cas6 [Melioribacter sp. OK-6-Me]|uniref:CRISPR system precrRNA processing endoribonuclease RAMP protein Cas6 n=1 Tax=unclassified Melioribacter TaxID=2627329 RepID=UPI003EDB5F30
MEQNLSLYKFIFRFESEEEISLPLYKWSMLRGTFGHSFKSVVCITKKKYCDKCLIKNQCSYYLIFETEARQSNLWFLNGVKKFPHPFIINSPDNDKTSLKKGETFDVSLTIIPKFKHLLPFFILTFQKFGQFGISSARHKLSLQKVFSVNSSGVTDIFDSATQNFNENFTAFNINLNSVKTNKVKLEFTTPLRIQENSTLIYHKDKITPDLLMRTILRRVYSVLTLFYDIPVTETNAGIQDISIVENDLYYQKIQRYSNRQKQKMEFGGLLGSIIISGKNLSEYLPQIVLASHFNIGKNTSFGYGSFKLTYL